MNGNEQIELHYMDNGYPYIVSEEGFTDFYGGVSASVPLPYVQLGHVNDQESAYWSVHMNSYQFAPSSSESTSYYGCLYGGQSTYNNGHALIMDFNRRAWEYPSMTIAEESVVVDVPSGQDRVSIVHSITEVHSSPEDRSPSHQDTVNSQVIWQDDIDPDNMTYEELLDLGEAVGTESRGLSQELIDCLPISKHKSGGFFSRKKSGDRCVICQMLYKRGDRKINLPCKHVYHTECGSKWLSINKTCPVCNTEVFGDESRH